jgi:hypothetical protein
MGCNNFKLFQAFLFVACIIRMYLEYLVWYEIATSDEVNHGAKAEVQSRSKSGQGRNLVID